MELSRKGSWAIAEPAQAKPANAPDESFQKVLASWSDAVQIFYSQRLKADERKMIDLKSLKAPFKELHDTTSNLMAGIEASRYPWTKDFRSAIDTINKFAVVGDIIVQHHAEYTSLVWGTVRFIIQFAAEEQRVSDTIAKGLNKALQVVSKAQFYAKLFSTPANTMSDGVFFDMHQNITNLYVEALTFLFRASVFFKKGTLHRYASAGLSSDAKLTAILDAMKELESAVDGGIRGLEAESRKMGEDFENGMWLQAADFDGDLKLRQQEYQPGTCSWFLSHEDYVDFRAENAPESNHFLWLTGKPGCGKSVLAAQNIQNLRKAGKLTVYVLCKSGQKRKDSIDAVVRNIVFQLLQILPEQSKWHRSLLGVRYGEKKEVTECTEALWLLLEQMVQEKVPIYLVLDAIDECKESQAEQYRFMKRLADNFRRNPKARIISTSRLQFSASESSVPWKVIQIKVEDTQVDIENIVAENFKRSETLDALPDKDQIQELITKRSDGMVIWAVLMMHELESNQWDPEGVLDQLPENLHALYKTILGRVLAQDSSKAKIISLQLVLAATRALRQEELAIGVAVGQGLPRHEIYDKRGKPFDEVEKIVRECNPLLTITPDGNVQAVHATFRQYILEIDHGFEKLSSAAIQRQMAMTAIKYLSYGCFLAAENAVPTSNQFLVEYATVNLLSHCAQTSDKDTPVELATFVTTAPGWKWARRLMSIYLERPEQVMAWQTRLSSWSLHSDAQSHNILANFFLYVVDSQLDSVKEISSTSLVRATALNDGAFVYRFLGRLEESKRMFEEAFLIRREQLGYEDYSTLETLSNLAFLAQEDGRWKQAIEIYVPLVEAAKSILPAHDMTVLLEQIDLAIVFVAQDNLDEAEKLLKEVTKISFEEQSQSYLVLGPLHLTAVMQMQNRWKEANDLMKTIMERTEGSIANDLVTAQSLLCQANRMEFEASYDEAEQLHRKRIDVLRRVRGLTHSRVSSYVSWINLLMRQERWAYAESCLLASLDEYKTLRAEHPDIIVLKARLATVHVRMKKYEKAEEALPRLLAVSRTEMGDDHIETVLLLRELANLRAAQGRHTEAEAIYREAMSTAKKIRGDDHSITLDTAVLEAQTWYALGKTPMAIEAMEKVIEKRRALLGSAHPDTVSSHNELQKWQNAEPQQIPDGSGSDELTLRPKVG